MSRFTRPFVFLVATALLATFAGCGGPTTVTETQLLAWGQALNAHLTTGGQDGDYAYPRQSLDQIDSDLTVGLTTTDAWGNELYYRRMRDDQYQLISRGADGELGNDDDIILKNGAFYAASKIYAEAPIER